MGITFLKMGLVVLIFACALIGGLLPIFTKKEGQLGWLLPYGEFFARGIFLGVALIHLLPDAVANFSAAHPESEYPVILALCAASVFAIQFIEQAAANLLQRLNISRAHLIAYWLMLLLSIHSLIEGLAVGFSETVAGLFILTAAIIVHKSSEAFALAISLRKSSLNRVAMVKFVVLFALMTPLGILIGSLLLNNLHGSLGETVDALFSAIAAGTFLYIGLIDTPDCEQMESQAAVLPKTLCFGLGIVLMAIVAYWL